MQLLEFQAISDGPTRRLTASFTETEKKWMEFNGKERMLSRILSILEAEIDNLLKDRSSELSA